MNNIILIGMPSSGKSTCGKPLAEKLDMGFVDTDTIMELSTGLNIHDILSKGSDYFSDCELQAGLSVSRLNNTVIATGGSMIYQENAMKELKNSGIIVFIQVQVEDILKSTSNRALIREGNESIVDLFNSRQPLYKQYADYIVDRKGKSIDTLVDEISRITRK